MMQRLKTIVDEALGWLVAALMGAAVVNVIWQVVTRFVVGRPSSFTEELARYLLIWIGLLGAAYATGRGMHLAIDLVPRAFSGAARRRLEWCIAACVLLFAAAVMIWGGARLAWMTFYLQQRSAAMRIPLGYVYLALPISGALMAYYALHAMLGGAPRQSPAENPPKGDR